jgi:hypothetical protein
VAAASAGVQCAAVRGAYDDNDERWTFIDRDGLHKLLVVVVPEHQRAWLNIYDNTTGADLGHFELDAATARTLGRILLDEFRGPTEPMEL